MVEMQDQDRDPKSRPQLGENPQHGHRIRAARNTQPDPVAWPHHGVPAERAENLSVDLFFHLKKPLRRIPSPTAGSKWSPP
jgi:hypothetical protein